MTKYFSLSSGRTSSAPSTPQATFCTRLGRSLLGIFRLTRLTLHLVSGLITVACVYPFISHSTQLALKQRWSLQLLCLLGLELKVGAGETAIEHWKRIEQYNPAYVGLVAERLMLAHTQLGKKDEGIALLRSWVEQYPSLDLLQVVLKTEVEAGRTEAAYQLVRDELRRNPTLLGLEKFLEAQIAVTPEARRADLELVKHLIHNHTRRVARYRCDACGFKARQFYWRCPGCGGWETYPPKRTEEFDITA